MTSVPLALLEISFTITFAMIPARLLTSLIMQVQHVIVSFLYILLIIKVVGPIAIIVRLQNAMNVLLVIFSSMEYVFQLVRSSIVRI